MAAEVETAAIEGVKLLAEAAIPEYENPPGTT
jgi:hypothetical protein